MNERIAIGFMGAIQPQAHIPLAIRDTIPSEMRHCAGTVIALVVISTLTACDAVFNRDAADAPSARLETLLLEQSDSLGRAFFMLPGPTDLADFPQDPKNPLTVEKVRLGKHLFHETAMASKNLLPGGFETYSCATCHHSRAGFQTGIRQALGEGGIGFGDAGEGRVRDSTYAPTMIDAQPVRTLSILNAGYHETALWDGSLGAHGPNRDLQERWPEEGPLSFNRLGYAGVETYALALMGAHRLSVENSEIRNNSLYRSLFAEAFPAQPEAARISDTNAALAIAAFSRTVVAYEAPFQQWLRGRTWVMTEQETEGAILFFGKAGCVSCHTGPGLSSDTFHALGLTDLAGEQVPRSFPPDHPARRGRGGIPSLSTEAYRFRTPQLYNLADNPYYGHGGTIRSLREVVAYKNAGLPANPEVDPEQLSPSFKPLGLTDGEIDALTAFLSAALQDPSLDRYDPAYVPSRNCFPNNDSRSRRDLRCF